MSTEINKALVERFDAIFGDPAIPSGRLAPATPAARSRD